MMMAADSNAVEWTYIGTPATLPNGRRREYRLIDAIGSYGRANTADKLRAPGPSRHTCEDRTGVRLLQPVRERVAVAPNYDLPPRETLNLYGVPFARVLTTEKTSRPPPHGRR